MVIDGQYLYKTGNVIYVTGEARPRGVIVILLILLLVFCFFTYRNTHDMFSLSTGIVIALVLVGWYSAVSVPFFLARIFNHLDLTNRTIVLRGRSPVPFEKVEAVLLKEDAVNARWAGFYGEAKIYGVEILLKGESQPFRPLSQESFNRTGPVYLFESPQSGGPSKIPKKEIARAVAEELAKYMGVVVRERSESFLSRP